jgi:regulator of cell morphogenesis and NO signaling
MLITSEMKLADAIHRNVLLLPVINRLGVQLGFGDKSIHKICLEKSIDEDFFLIIINAFLDQDINKTLKIKAVSIKDIVEYLKATHQYYLERMIPEIENRMNALIQHADIDQSQFVLVKDFFSEYKKELYSHIKLEEEAVYPYVLEVYQAYQTGKTGEALLAKIASEPIESYAKEHTDIESKLFDLKNILIKYLPETQDSYLRNQVLNALFDLENDLNDHSRIENMVLVPRIAEIEHHLAKTQA